MTTSAYPDQTPTTKATDGNAKKALVGLKAIADLALQAFPDERLTWEVG